MSTSLLWNLLMFELPGVIEGDMSERKGSESTEPLVGRRGRQVSEDSAYKPQCGEMALCWRVGRMGSIKRRWTGTE